MKYTRKHLYIFLLCAGLCLWAGNLTIITVGDVSASPDLGIEETDLTTQVALVPEDNRDAQRNSTPLPMPVAYVLLGTGLVGLACFSRKSS